MYARLLRFVSPAVFVYLLLFSVLGFLVLQGFLLLDPSTLAEWLLMGVPAGVSVLAAVKALSSVILDEVSEAARSELSSTVKDRHWLPDSDRDVIRLWFRYGHSGPAAQEVFWTLLDDALAAGADLDALRLLDSAQALTSEGPR